MNKTLFASFSALLMLSFVVPVSGYHIQPNPVVAFPPTGDPLVDKVLDDTTKYSSDFVIANPLLILCESDGPTDPVNPNPLVLPGIGGLCYSGQNKGTGPVSWVVTDPKKKDKPEKYELERFDLCVLPTSHRLDPASATGFPVASCHAAATTLGLPLAVVPLTTQAWEFFAQVGTFGCTVLAHEEFYYSSRYAWMTWDAPVVGGNGHVSAFPDLVFSLPSIAAYIAASVPAGLPFTATDALTPIMGSGDNAKVAGLPLGAVNCGGSTLTEGPTWVGNDPAM